MTSIIPNRSIIKISGIDSTKFLQNLVTNDVSSCSNDAIYAMILSPQGRFLFDMFILKIESGYFLDILTSTKDLLLKKLRMYKINMQVEVEDFENLCVGYNRTPARLQSYKDPRFISLGYRMIMDACLSTSSSYLVDKYQYAIPDGGVDLLYDKAMPQEYGAESLNAISYTKGCYVGQEVISRTKSQGVVRKRIYKVTVDCDLSATPHGTEIMLNSAKIGIFCSGYLGEGIALIRDSEIGEINDICHLGDIEIRLKIACWYNTMSHF